MTTKTSKTPKVAKSLKEPKAPKPKPLKARANPSGIFKDIFETHLFDDLWGHFTLMSKLDLRELAKALEVVLEEAVPEDYVGAWHRKNAGETLRGILSTLTQDPLAAVSKEVSKGLLEELAMSIRGDAELLRDTERFVGKLTCSPKVLTDLVPMLKKHAEARFGGFNGPNIRLLDYLDHSIRSLTRMNLFLLEVLNLAVPQTPHGFEGLGVLPSLIDLMNLFEYPTKHLTEASKRVGHRNAVTSAFQEFLRVASLPGVSQEEGFIEPIQRVKKVFSGAGHLSNARGFLHELVSSGSKRSLLQFGMLTEACIELIELANIQHWEGMIQNVPEGDEVRLLKTSGGAVLRAAIDLAQAHLVETRKLEEVSASIFNGFFPEGLEFRSPGVSPPKN